MDFLDQLSEVYHYWFLNPKIWIETNINKRNKIDKFISLKYRNILYIISNIDNSIIFNFPTRYILISIILLDQISRHIYRNENISSLREKALHLSNYIIFKQLKNNLSNDELIFVLMPYKHIDNYKYFNIIRNIINQRINLESDDIDKNQKLYKFYLDSLKKYLDKSLQNPLNSVQFNRDLISDIELSNVCEFYSDLTNTYSDCSDEYLYNICDDYLDNINQNRLTISLSGGPDSMVLAYIFNIICKKRDIKIRAIHINYNNRDESLKEEFLVSKFCSKIKLELFVYRINHFKRKFIERSTYEKITRDIRFKLYKKFNSHTILGHIKDDLIENIWTNFTHGRDLFKLHKMDKIGVIENVIICRPFLEVEKHNIISFAHRYYVPYLKNTTPKNSNRGKMRETFLPEVSKQFGDSVNEKILYLSKTLESYKKILDKEIFNPIFESIKIKDKSYKLNITRYIEMPIHFWHIVFTKIFHQLNISKPKYKTIILFLEFINKKKSGYFTFNNKTKIYLKKPENLLTINILT